VNASLLPDDIQGDPHAAADAAAARLSELTGAETHDVALVMGSGWAPAADALGVPDAEFPVTELPGFPPPAVEGHGGTIRSYRIGEKRALVFLGRTHYYEGRGVAAVAHGVRTAVAAGSKTIVLTNGCGGLREGMRPGQPVLISDHINLTATSPIVGANFVDLTDLYSPRLRALCKEIDSTLEEGVYAQFPGPHYETPAEINMLRTLGADLVGMSTALEAIAARHCRMDVLGISLATNLAAGISPHPLSHEEVLEAIAAREAGAEVLGISLVTNLAAGMTGEPLNHEEVLQAGRDSATRMGALLTQVLSRL
jgi:purine-nucleoside phosphorylase